jgi:hypothetical protein
MQAKQMVHQIIDLNKTAYEQTMKHMTILQEWMETQARACVDYSPGTPASKQAARDVLAMCRKSIEDCRTLVDGNIKKMETLFRNIA